MSVNIYLWVDLLKEMGLDPHKTIEASVVRCGHYPEDLNNEQLLVETLIKTNDRIKKLEEEIACMKQEKNSST